jgi:hypothetical protein
MTYAPIVGVKVVGVTGAARHGKDTFAKALLLSVPGAERIAFSDLIAASERIAGRMTERDPEHLQATHFTINRDHLLCAMYEFIRDRKPNVCVITGVRKPDEVEMIKALGGKIVKVRRLLDGGGVFKTDDRDPAHAVEADIDWLPHDILIIASTSLEVENAARYYVQELTR